MSDLISRQALCDDLREYKVHPVPISSDESEVKGYNDGINLAISVIAKFPSAEPERTAKVEVHSHPCGVSGKCCACGGDVYNGDPYCSHCGAKLDWSGNERN